MTELFLENKRIDISQELSSLITYAIDDVKDFSTRNTAFSKTIVLPGTSNNNFQFGNIFNVTVSNTYDSTADNVATNFNASVSASCLIFHNHLQVFKGTLRLLEIIIDNGVPEYEVAVFGELGSLVSAIGNGKLEDLDFSAYDHVYNTTNILSSWDNTSGVGYYYPLIDYGGVSSNKKDYDIRALRPAFFVREYIDKIFDGAGYTWTSDFMDSARVKSWVIPHNVKNFQRSSYTLINASRTTGAQVMNSGTLSPVNLSFNTYPLYFFTGGPATFTYSGASNVNTSVRISLAGNYVANATNFTLKLYHNGVEITAFRKTIPLTGDNNSRFYNWNEQHDIIFAPGDTLVLKYESDFTPTGIDSITAIGGLQVVSYTPVSVDINVGDSLVMNELIPRNILQKDFLASVVKLSNLYVYEDSVKTKHLYIKPYTDFYDLNVSGVVDWTYKVDRSRPIRLKPMSEINARFYNFRFKKDADYYNELYFNRYNQSYGDYEFDSAFEFAKDNKDITLIFSPSVLLGYTGEDKVVPALFKKNNGIEERMDTNVRILQTKKVTGVASWTIKDGASSLASGTVYGYGGHYDDPDAPANDIHFGVPAELFFVLATGAISNTQFNLYWSSYMAEITDKDSKLYAAFFKLTPADINELDFSKLIYCDGTYWRLNKIEDYNASSNDVCKVELLKLIYLFY